MMQGVGSEGRGLVYANNNVWLRGGGGQEEAGSTAVRRGGIHTSNPHLYHRWVRLISGW